MARGLKAEREGCAVEKTLLSVAEEPGLELVADEVAGMLPVVAGKARSSGMAASGYASRNPMAVPLKQVDR